MRWRALVLLLLAAATSARADESAAPPVGLSLGLGAAVAIAPLCAGGSLVAARDDLELRRTGLYITLTGLTLAPLTSHLTAHEYRRALWFTIAPLVGSITTVATLETHPELLDHGHALERVIFGIGLSVAVLGAVVGLADSAGAADRWRARQPLAVAPLADAHGGGVAASGRF